MNSMQRILKTLGHEEPDQVPLFLALSLHGAKELGIPLREYFRDPAKVAEGQLRLQEKYDQDCLYALYYAPLEIEAAGGEVLHYDDGPANSGKPMIDTPEQIPDLKMPHAENSPLLGRVLETIALLKRHAGDEMPVLGVAVSPFSLPVMQMGFEAYLELIHSQEELFEILMQKNEDFCVSWANAQLQAGATALAYFDPVSSPTIIPKELYLRTGFRIAHRTIARIRGPMAAHMASGRVLPMVDEVAQCGAAIISAGYGESLSEVKQACRGKLTVLGNLNGIEMRRWTPEEAEAQVKAAIAAGARGGGFMLSDLHGEIPWQVPDEVLLAICRACRRWGRYPLEWITDDAT